MQQARERLVAEPAAGGERVVVMMLPVVRRLSAQGYGDRHLRHHGGAAAADQATVGEQHLAAGARRLDRRIHAGSARTDHQDVSFGSQRLVAHDMRFFGMRFFGKGFFVKGFFGMRRCLVTPFKPRRVRSWPLPRS
jgi:hypothetical protein